MGMYYIGEVIKRTREGLGMTQENLCDGICSPETLSRIETGKSVPSRANFQTLMERMGKCGRRYLPFIYSDDIHVIGEWDKLNKLLTKRQYKEISAMLLEFEMKIDMNEGVNRQFVKRMRAISDYYLERIDVKEMRSQLIKALHCTIPEYGERIIVQRIYSRYEIRIICNIAVTYMIEGELNKAIDIMNLVEQYFLKTKIDKAERNVSEVLFVSNFSQCLGRCGKTKEALAIGQRGIDMCLDAGDSSNLADFLYNVGFEMELLMMDEKACKEKLIQAYCVAELNRNSAQMKHIEAHWKNKYGKEMYF